MEPPSATGVRNARDGQLRWKWLTRLVSILQERAKRANQNCAHGLLRAQLSRDELDCAGAPSARARMNPTLKRVVPNLTRALSPSASAITASYSLSLGINSARHALHA